MAKEKKKYNSVFKRFRGQSRYAKLYEPDEYNGVYNWKIGLVCSDSTKQKIKDAGIQLKWKDDDGESSNVQGQFVTFKKGTEAEINGEVVKFPPPKVYDKNNKLLVDYKPDGDGGFDMIGDEVLIGNGSDIEVTVQVYQTKRFGKGCRLFSVKIIDLIEYTPPEESEDEDDDDTPFEPKEEPKKEEKSERKSSKKVSW